MTSLEPFIANLENSHLIKFLQKFESQKKSCFSEEYHGDFVKWNDALIGLKKIYPGPTGSLPDYDLNCGAVRIGNAADLSQKQTEDFKNVLRQFHPWRKGPFELFGIYIDSEWRSDLKWERIKNHLSSMENRHVLDIGCGNGYHCWRMIDAGAKTVLGIDPMLHYVMQFNIFKSYLPLANIELLPQGIENLPGNLSAFETVFSLGVLYHRRSPIDHLIELKEMITAGGELVLETLVIDGPKGETLVPEGRYAKMRNVWFIPSILTLEGWFKRCAFKNIHLVDVTQTTDNEQRSTKWMEYESLKDFLQPQNPNITIEGYPAPKRAIFICSV
jgi:tRNA (mo5U34)-methyltransferase